MARILLGVTGGIAAYKGLELARLATRAGHAVRVLMTPAATRFVGAASFEGVAGGPVLIDEFERDPMRGAFPGDPTPAHDPIGHLAVVGNADAYLIAPASANTVAKLAAGTADSMVTTSFLACTAPRAIAPAMNDRMYADGATQSNLAVLRERGVQIIGPEEGELASRGEYGLGRLPSPERLLREIEALVGTPSGPWDGMRVVVSAGGTREPIDSVRFIGNRSSGRMGFALAGQAAQRGADVALVAANVSLAEPAGVRRIDVETTAELAAAVRSEFEGSHVLLMAAAVADFRAANVQAGKIERKGSEPLELHLERTDDVLADLANVRTDDQTVVGFAAEHGADAIQRARAKLERKGLDAIVFNDVSRSDIGFNSDQNEVVIVDREGERRVELASKREVADAILDRVQALRAKVGNRKSRQ
jgi:phosphopantothenoylcysteine decarboxylase / phosphopantothenate---cysteine ligase